MIVASVAWRDIDAASTTAQSYKSDARQEKSEGWITPVLYLLATASGFLAFAQLGFVATFPTYVRGAIMLGPAAAVFLSSLTHCGSLAARFFVAAATDGPLARRRLTTLSLIHVLVGVTIFTFSFIYSARGGKSLAIWAAVAVLMGGTVMGWNSIVMMAVRRSVPDVLASKASSVSLFSAYAGTVLGPSLFQTLGQETTLNVIMPTVAIVLVGSAILIAFAARLENRDLSGQQALGSPGT
jgi:hypothetical protein